MRTKRIKIQKFISEVIDRNKTIVKIITSTVCV